MSIIPPPPPASDAFTLVDRTYISQFSSTILGLVNHQNGVPTNADGSVTATMVDTNTGVTIFLNRLATNPAVGVYDIQLTSVDTQVPDPCTVTWNYTFAGNPEVYQTFVLIGAVDPAYDNLEPGLQEIVNNVWVRIQDLYDSPNGGPALQAYFQSRFGRGRVAQLMQIALNRINLTFQPVSHYTLNYDSSEWPYATAAGLLDEATYIEVIKHLIRSYVEQPTLEGATVAKLNRQEYMGRWQQVLQIEEQTFKQMMDVWKISQMGLSRTRLLVSGGVFGNYSNRYFRGLAAARGNYWQRFF